MVKKLTITCKACGGEHMGRICTKFSSVRVLEPAARKTVIAGLLAAPKAEKPKPAKKAKKAKKKKRAKKRAKMQASTTQPIAAPTENGGVVITNQPEKTGDQT